jgi:hypothetical protein
LVFQWSLVHLLESWPKGKQKAGDRMTQYGRRDFLLALGAGAAAVSIAKALPKQDPIIPAGGRINASDSSNVEFPWEFSGHVELPAAQTGMGHADLIALQISEPPDGYRVFARGMRIAIREDARLKDIKTFLDSWTMSFRLGDITLFGGPVWLVMFPIGIRSDPRNPRYLPSPEQIPLPIDRPSQLALHGKPFPLNGPFVIEAAIYGVGVKQRTA